VIRGQKQMKTTAPITQDDEGCRREQDDRLHAAVGNAPVDNPGEEGQDDDRDRGAVFQDEAIHYLK
jgi:hypothetical protein